MTREKMRQYRALKKEIVRLEGKIAELERQEMKVPTVLGKVTASSHEFPYIQTHVTVEMDEPKESSRIKDLRRMKEHRKAQCEALVIEIEQFIASIPDSVDRQIFEMAFLEGKKQIEIAEATGYSRSRVTQKISDVLKD